MRANITRRELVNFVRSLGADPSNVQHIDVDPFEITVTSYRLDEIGGRFVEDDGEGGKRAAVETTVIEIVGGKDDTTVQMRHPKLPDREIKVSASASGHLANSGWQITQPEPQSALDWARSQVGVPYVPGSPPVPDPSPEPSGQREQLEAANGEPSPPGLVGHTNTTGKREPVLTQDQAHKLAEGDSPGDTSQETPRGRRKPKKEE